jgi:hydrogenase-4 component B
VALPRILEPALFAWSPQLPFAGVRLAEAAPLGWITLMGLVGAWLWKRLAASPQGAAGTWDCGFARPTARMQYTASSFGEMFVKLFAAVLRPRVHPPEVQGLFPGKSSFSSHVPEAVLELVMAPLLAATDRRFSLARKLQHGRLHLYILYIFVTLALLLAWAY